MTATTEVADDEITEGTVLGNGETIINKKKKNKILPTRHLESRGKTK